MISYITRVHHLITVLMLLSQRSRDPDSLLLHWPQREGDCAIAGAAAADGTMLTHGKVTHAPRHAPVDGKVHAYGRTTTFQHPALSWRHRFCSVNDHTGQSRCTARTQYPPRPVRVLCVCTPRRNGRWQNLEKTSSSSPCIRWDATLKSREKIHQLSHWWTVAMQSLWLYTDQNISRWTEGVHAKLTPLVWEKNILQPLVYHGVDFLESVQRSDINKWAI